MFGLRTCSSIDENNFAGFGGGVVVDGETAMGYQVLDDGFGGSGGIGFAIGQPVTQIGLPMPLEKRPARILGRSDAPFLPSPMAFPNLPFHLVDDFVMVDRHGCGLSPES
jgi:hypothetical protein